ncbi:MAG: 1,4-dihydroxy-2-naphthoate octaprenyltransferase [Deferribacteraceae bacterium]|jgi:1,4-dihydroxy-2-naphthoate octaprenyltransferase|nr:1,4-dihydroxy-2-naphthoate octaprenyltransferase [Deferribacteraceae bacterium]
MKRWFSAARPKTLPASISPVIIAYSLAYKDGFTSIIILFACLGVALSAQTASNFANDYFDWKKGADSPTRLGPKRAVAMGEITPREMRAGIVFMLALTAAFGVIIAYERGFWLLAVGVLICTAALAYSAGPYPLAYHGLGDICVVIFYGLIPVIFTYYAVTGGVSIQAVLISLSLGLMADNILLVNNYRDYREDALSGKNTSIVLFGRRFGAALFLGNIIIAFSIAFYALQQFSRFFIIIYLAFFALTAASWVKLNKRDGLELNPLLAEAGRNVLIFALLLSAGALGFFS